MSRCTFPKCDCPPGASACGKLDQKAPPAPPRHVRATLLAPWLLPAALLGIAVGTCLLALLEALGALAWLALAVVVLGVHLALLWASVAALREQTERELVALQSRVTDLEATR